MSLKKNVSIFSFFFLFFLINSSFLFAAKTNYKVESCSPNQLIQGQENITLNIITNAPMPQKTANENLYSEIIFSNPYIRIKKVEFKNDRMINCVVDVDRFADVDKKIDLDVISYDEAGNEVIFKGKNLIEITRQSFIDRIIVHTFDGRVKIGQSASVTIRGTNFEEGKVKVLLMWSGLKPFKTDSPNGRQIRLELTEIDTAKLKPGKYNFYVYNKDGSGVKSEAQIEVVA